MLAYECPSCGASVSFASAATVFTVCPHCRSMVVRTDKKLEAIGTIADLLPDVSPLQIGTRGRWRDREFTLLGRVRLAWEEGSWTEWFLDCANGEHGWLGEAQGFFTISFPDAETIPQTNPRSLAAGTDLTLASGRWRVMDGKDVRVVAAQGELPFVPRMNAERYSLDLAGPENRFATIEADGSAVSVFVGESLTFDQLGLTNLRDVPGWSKSAAPQAARVDSRTVRCPHCAAAVDLRASGQTLAVVCGSCGTILDPSSADVAIIQRADAAQKSVAAVLPLGARGEFDGTVYELIGCMVRADTYASWSEYLLFNPWQGFRWLVTYRGHWTLVDRLLSPPPSAGSRAVSLRGKHYNLFARGKTEVKAVLGEFYWQVKRGEMSEAADFVAPPGIVSQETYPGFSEETWSAGKYISPDGVRRAFFLPQKLARPEGVYLNQPNPHQVKWERIRGPFGCALLLLIAIQAWFLAAHPQRLQVSQTFQVSPTSTAFATTPVAASRAGTLTTPASPRTTFTNSISPAIASSTAAEPGNTGESTAKNGDLDTEAFTVTGHSQPVVVTFSAPISNTWIDVDVQLINRVTGEARSEQTELSYYFGYDSDGSWSEGSRSAHVEFAAVVPGTYFLRIEPEADPKAPELPLKLQVHTGGIFWSNFFASLALLLIYPLWVLYRRHVFERERWGDSDFSAPSSVSFSDDS